MMAPGPDEVDAAARAVCPEAKLLEKLIGAFTPPFCATRALIVANDTGPGHGGRIGREANCAQRAGAEKSSNGETARSGRNIRSSAIRNGRRLTTAEARLVAAVEHWQLVRWCSARRENAQHQRRPGARSRYIKRRIEQRGTTSAAKAAQNRASFRVTVIADGEPAVISHAREIPGPAVFKPPQRTETGCVGCSAQFAPLRRFWRCGNTHRVAARAPAKNRSLANQID